MLVKFPTVAGGNAIFRSQAVIKIDELDPHVVGEDDELVEAGSCDVWLMGHDAPMRLAESGEMVAQKIVAIEKPAPPQVAVDPRFLRGVQGQG